jgi:hypothetical protein
MCQRVTCSSCGKPTYAGCGRHIEAVLGDVPADERCRCREKKSDATASGAGPGWFRGWFGGAKGRQP